MNLKKILAAVAAGSMAVTAMAMSASAASYDAFLMFTDWDWGWGSWDPGVCNDTKVDGFGTYTVSLTAEQVGATAATNGAQILCVDVIGAGADFTADNSVVTIDSLTADGVEVAVDNSKIVWGDIEENGNFRIEIRNTYGKTGDVLNDANYNPIDADGFTAEKEISVTFTIADVNAPAAAETEAAPAEEATDDVATAVEATTTETTAPATGNTTAVAIASVMAVAGAAAIVAKKRK